HLVSVRHVTAALQSVGGANLQQEVRLNRQEVTQILNRMFHSVSQEVAGHVTMEASEEVCSLMFRLFDRSQAGCLSAGSLQTALIALSAESLLGKYRALVSVAEDRSGSVSRSGLRSLLQNLSQVPVAVQEDGVFGGVEAAVRSCFNGVLTPAAGEEHVLSWLQSEPRLLLWLPTLYRLSVSQNVSHSVRCHTCKTLPITGLRYRCMKCVNVHVCQNCFLTDRQTRKHKSHHPVLEYCTQPTWRETLSSLVCSTRHALLPRRYTRREADRKRVLMWVEPAETQNSAPPPSDPSTQLAVSAVSQRASSDGDGSHDASVQPPPCSFSSKALQTDEETQTQQVSSDDAVRSHFPEWLLLLEQQLQVWRLTVQSEQGILDDRCSEMEVTMETLREHNLHLQSMLITQALNKMEAQQQSFDTKRENLTPTSDTQRHTEEDEEGLGLDWSEEEQQTPSPTMNQDAPPSHDIHCEKEEEESAGNKFLSHPIGQHDGPEEAGPQGEDTCPSEEEEEEEEEEENCGTCSPEEMLLEVVERVKSVMETDRWRERQTGESEEGEAEEGEKKRAELLEVANQVPCYLRPRSQPRPLLALPRRVRGGGDGPGTFLPGPARRRPSLLGCGGVA
ncbi:hypothetical protein L3Q82_010058, partial [Scortum barcoo]